MSDQAPPRQAGGYVGIDGAKGRLDAAALPNGALQRVANDDAGRAQLVAWVVDLAPTLVVLEATGGS